MMTTRLRWSLPLVLALGSGCGSDNSLTAIDETAAELSESEVDGVEGLGPRPEHQLILDCTMIAVPPEGDRGPRHPPPPPDGDVDGGEMDGGEPGTCHGEHPRGGGGPGHFAWVYDADGSGDLDEAERAELEADLIMGCEARNAALLESYDTDGDGVLSDAELEAAQADIDAEMEAMRAAALAEFDTDGDGELSHDEREAMREARRAELLAEFDTNGDGELDETERAALAEAIKEAIRTGIRPPFAPPPPPAG